MNGIVDTLQVLIEANYSGLQMQLKQGLNQITQFVQTTNAQKIDWEKILSGSITPAIVATIATTFAIAINQALQFQAAMEGASLNTQQSFQTNMTAMSGSIYGVSNATGESANDIANALGIVGEAYKNTGDQQTVLADLSEYAAVEGTTVTAAAQQLIPLLQSWGISASDAGTVMATLGESTSYGKINLDQLATSLTNVGTTMSKITTLPSAIVQLQELSTAPGATPSGVLSQFDAIVAGANKTNLTIDGIVGNISQIVSSNKSGGIIDAFQKVADKMKDVGSIAAPQLASAMGINTDAMNADLNSTTDNFIELKNAAANVQKNLPDLSTWFTENETDITHLKQAWETFVNDLGSIIGPAVIKVITDMIGGLDTLVDILNEAIKGKTDTLNAVVTGAMGTNQIIPSTPMFNGQSGLNNPTGSAPSFSNPGLGSDTLTNNSFSNGINTLVQAIKSSSAGSSSPVSVVGQVGPNTYQNPRNQ